MLYTGTCMLYLSLALAALSSRIFDIIFSHYYTVSTKKVTP